MVKNNKAVDKNQQPRPKGLNLIHKKPCRCYNFRKKPKTLGVDMAGKQTFNTEEEFAGLDRNSSRLEKRFIRTMETLSKQPDKSIWFCSENRAEASETKFPQQYTDC
jgi:hypothetical protein